MPAQWGMDVVRLLSLILLVWTVPWAATSMLAEQGRDAATAAAFALILAAVMLERDAPMTFPRPSTVAAGFCVGGAGYAGWGVVIAAVGEAMGLEPFEPPTATPALPTVVAVLVLAPAFEELLYRERLLEDLRGLRWGLPLRLLASALLFALPHGEPWPVLGTAIVGVGLAAAYEFTRSVAFCMAAHAGLNAAALVGIEAMVAPSLVLGSASLAWQGARIARWERGGEGRLHGIV